MAACYPDEETDEAREGTAAHEVMERLVLDSSRGTLTMWSEFDGKKAANDVPFTFDMYEGALMLAADVRNVMVKTGVFVPRVEERLIMPRIYEGMFGTPDVVLIDTVNKIIYIWDYKFGRTIVFADSKQLVCYLAGVLDQLGLNGLEEQEWRAEVAIVQPRRYHPLGSIRRKTYYATEWRGLFNQLNGKCAEADTNPKCTTGNHCKHCPGVGDCSAATSAGYNAIELIDQAPEIDALTDDQLGTILGQFERAEEAIEFKLKSYQAAAFKRIQAGGRVPGYTVTNTPGRGRNWTLSDEDIIATGQACNVDLRNKKPITPNQAIEAGLDEETALALSEKKPGSLKLTHDYRDELAQEVFK